jgi:hypothetical protein
LEHQIKAALFELAKLSPAKVSPLVRLLLPEALSVFKDAYIERDQSGPRGWYDSLKEGHHLGILMFPAGAEHKLVVQCVVFDSLHKLENQIVFVIFVCRDSNSKRNA